MEPTDESFRPARPGPRATWQTLAVLAAFGVAFDLAFNGQFPGISFPLFVVALATGLRFAGPKSTTTDLLLAGAAVIAVFPALRAADALIAVNVAVVGLLLALAVLRPERVAEAGIASFVRAAVRFVLAALGVFAFLGAPFGGLAQRLRADRWRPVARGILIAVPAVLFFALLLGSADPVFAGVVLPSLPDWGLLSLVGHVVLTVFGTFAVAVAWRAAVASERIPAGAPSPARPQLAFAEWATALGALDALFALFVLVQFAFLFGGSHRVEVTDGLTYAEYARSGFVQLIIAGGLVVGVVLTAWDFGSRSTQREVRTFRWLAGTMVGLCGVILASALQRLALYEGAFGFTARRFAGYAIIVFTALVLAIVLVTLLRDQRRRLVPSALAAALLVVLAVNLVNPVRFIADQNARRFRSTGKIDAFYLSTLGPDAVPVVVDLLPSLKGADADVIRSWLCLQREASELSPGWRSWNLARAAAPAAIRPAGLSGRTCAALPDAPLSPSTA